MNSYGYGFGFGNAKSKSERRLDLKEFRLAFV